MKRKVSVLFLDSDPSAAGGTRGRGGELAESGDVYGAPHELISSSFCELTPSVACATQRRIRSMMAVVE